jgi:hypothetical protein
MSVEYLENPRVLSVESGEYRLCNWGIEPLYMQMVEFRRQ